MGGGCVVVRRRASLPWTAAADGGEYVCTKEVPIHTTSAVTVLTGNKHAVLE